MAGSRVLFVLVSSALLGCATERAPKLPSPELQTRNEIAAPAPEAWRTAADGLATDLAQSIGVRDAKEPASLAPVEGGVPPYFRDALLANLVARGARIAEPDTETSLRITCRATPVGVLPVPRGHTIGPSALPGELLILCLLAQDGAYVAAVQRSLPMPATPEPPPRGMVLEVTG